MAWSKEKRERLLKGYQSLNPQPTMIRIKLNDSNAAPGSRWGVVLDEHGSIIGEAHDSTYHGRAYAVHTKAWAGFVPLEQIEIVEEKK